MGKFYKFSILTPSYNHGKFIEENIQSVLRQDYQNFEHIIMDGGSTDNTLKILNKYTHLIWKSEKDRGQAHALNKTMKIATGDIICWLNSDDILCDGAFEEVNKFFYENPDKYVVVGNILKVDENRNLLWKEKAHEISYDGLLNRGQCVQQPSTFFRKEVFEKMGDFDETFHYTMDHELFLRAARHFKFYTIDKDLTIFRKYPQSKTGSKEIEFVKDLIRVKIKHRAKLFSYDNLRLLMMFIKEPFKKSHRLRMLIRKLRGANPDYRYYR